MISLDGSLSTWKPNQTSSIDLPPATLEPNLPSKPSHTKPSPGSHLQMSVLVSEPPLFLYMNGAKSESVLLSSSSIQIE